jgi:peptidoglycan/LPS O-acetylase OafA/YrhL
MARNAPIDLLRGVAILLVLLLHYSLAYRLSRSPLSDWFGVDAVRAVVNNGNYGVTMFFAASDYLITSNTLRRFGSLGAIDVRAFYVMRAARRRALIVAMCLCAIAVGPMYRHGHADNELFSVSGYAACFDAITFGCLAALLASVKRHAPLAARWLGVGAGLALAAMRELVPRAQMGADWKLPGLLLFITTSAAVAALVARYFSEPINAALRARFDTARAPARSVRPVSTA